MNKKPEPLDINSAAIDELTTLPGVGLTMAERIIEARPYAAVDELRRVSGIGPSALERIRPLIKVKSTNSKSRAIEKAPAEAEAIEVATKPVESPVTQKTPPQEEMPVIEEIPPLTEETIPLEITPPEETELEEEVIAEVQDVIESAPPVPGIEAEPATPETTVKLDDSKEELPPEPPVMEATPAPNAVQMTAPAAPPVEQQASSVRRTEVYGIALTFGFLSLLLSVVISLGILYLVNDGLLFVRPVELRAVDQRLSGVSLQTTQLQQDIDGLRTRLDNLESLAGRVNSVEKEAQQLRSDMDTVSADAERLDQQVTQLTGQLKELQASSQRFQTFLDGLQKLLNGLPTP
jgi:prefoldin subunit 5